MNVWLVIRSFSAIFLCLMGMALIFGRADAQAVVGAMLAALGLSFFWRLWIAARTGQ